jgi:hypothetical protein
MLKNKIKNYLFVCDYLFPCIPQITPKYSKKKKISFSSKTFIQFFQFTLLPIKDVSEYVIDDKGMIPHCQTTLPLSEIVFVLKGENKGDPDSLLYSIVQHNMCIVGSL